MLKYDLWDKVIKPQIEIELAIKQSEKPITIDLKAKQKPVSDRLKVNHDMECNMPRKARVTGKKKPISDNLQVDHDMERNIPRKAYVTGNGQRRKKRDFDHREEPKRVVAVTAPT